MKYFADLALFLLSASVTAQIEHAPTVAQCQADQRLWFSQVQQNGKTSPARAVMIERIREMINCIQVDPATNRVD